MRFYIKLILFIILFGCASSSRVGGLAGDLAYEARVTFVCTFGSAADYEALVEDTRRMRFGRCGTAACDAEREEFSRLKAECERKAFGPVLDVMKARDGRAPQE